MSTSERNNDPFAKIQSKSSNRPSSSSLPRPSSSSEKPSSSLPRPSSSSEKPFRPSSSSEKPFRPSSSSEKPSRPSSSSEKPSSSSETSTLPRASSAPSSRRIEEDEEDDDYDDLEEMDYGENLSSYLLYQHGDGSILNVAELLLLNKQSIDKQTEVLDKINKTLIALVNKKSGV